MAMGSELNRIRDCLLNHELFGALPHKTIYPEDSEFPSIKECNQHSPRMTDKERAMMQEQLTQATHKKPAGGV
jgi:hypothetical protein